ncbi:MAG: glutamate-1-semialdehyde 2,1-aminomutase [Lentisphaeria bacterium]|jgi:glutamate-1-semialdehyde 2,1-aminomutase
MPDSATLFARALKVIPGGVNSPVRAFGAVGGTPVYVAAGQGARLTTVEGRELLDFCGSWGPLILGHADPRVVEAVCRAAALGTTFGINTPGEVEFAEQLCAAIPGLDQVRLVSSGTEATMTALRLARGHTGRRKILKFDGCYHGHADYLLVAAGSGLLTHGLAASAGVCPGAVEDVLVAPYNDAAAVADIASRHGADLAAIIVEPIAGNMGLVEPLPGFLAGLRAVADRTGALLIFDEVITGFRLAPTSFGALCGITPDLTCLGKIAGGGLPLGAVGGRREVMQKLAPCGPVYQAGTLSGNPVAVAAGLATLRALRETPPYDAIAARTTHLVCELRKLAAAAGRHLHIASRGGMFTIYFQAGPVHNLADAKRSDTAAHARFFHAMLDQGVYLPPSQFEVAFVSAAHTDRDSETFLAAAAKALTP